MVTRTLTIPKVLDTMQNMSPSLDTASTNQSQCPTQDLLRDYIFGLTDDFVSSTIDHHLENCERCNHDLLTIESEETSTGGSKLENAIVADAIQSAKQSGFSDAIFETISLDGTYPPSIIGPYRLLQSIGRGGMGRVYKAEHTKLQKTVAVKLLPLHGADSHAIERFEREVLATGRLSHPAIVTATDAGVDSGIQYLAMEFIDGWDLGKLVQRLGALSIPDVCEIARQIALGLSQAHTMGMVHRDIKPSNIMLDVSGNVKLLDFGLVLIDRWDSPANELTTVGQFLGTLDYMAPEQAERSATVDHRSDLYSLGATMFRLLANQLPLAMLPSQSPIEKLRVLSNHSPVKINTLRSDLPRELATIVDNLLQTRPENRIPSAAHVAQALEPFCKGAKLRELASAAGASIPAELNNISVVNKATRAMATNTNPVQPKLRRGVPWWCIPLIAILPLAFYLGVILILESDQGNLVIESDSDDVRVRLTPKNRSADKQLAVKKGNTLTSIPSGEYDISIESPFDSVTIDQSTIVLKRGSTIVARIAKQDKPSGQEADLAPRPGSRFAAIELPQKFLEMEYKGRTVSQYLATLERELDYTSWRNALAIISIAVDPETKSKLRDAIKQIAEENRFLNYERIFELRRWLTFEEIDEAIAKSLQKSRDRELVDSQFSTMLNRFDAGDADFPSFKQVPKTWQVIEDILRTSDLTQIRLSSNASSQGMGRSINRERALFLLARFPLTAYAFSLDSGSITDLEVNSARWRAWVVLLESMDLEQSLWLIHFTYPGLESLGAEELTFWTSVQRKLAPFVQKWTESHEVWGSLGKANHPFQPNVSNGVSIIRCWLPSFSMGGMGGGMGGMGGGSDGGMYGGASGGGSMPTGEGYGRAAKHSLPVAAAVLMAWEKLPLSLRSTTEISQLSEMLKTKVADGALRSEKIFGLDWDRLQWSEEGDMQYTPINARSGSEFDELDREPVLAFVLHRWVNNLMTSDCINPSNLAQNFVRELGNFTPNSEIGIDGRKYLTKRASNWNPKAILEFVKQPYDSIEFEVQPGLYKGDSYSMRGHLATYTGIKNTGNNFFVTIFFELEPQGWRISKMTRFLYGEEISVFEY